MDPDSYRELSLFFTSNLFLESRRFHRAKIVKTVKKHSQTFTNAKKQIAILIPCLKNIALILYIFAKQIQLEFLK